MMHYAIHTLGEVTIFFPTIWMPFCYWGFPGKLVFAETVPKDEAATWREKLDQLYKSSSQSFRVVVHGSKVRKNFFSFSLLVPVCL